MSDRDTKRHNAIVSLKRLQKLTDTEQAHVKADDIVLDYLIQIGEGRVAKEYSRIRKWYG